MISFALGESLELLERATSRFATEVLRASLRSIEAAGVSRAVAEAAQALGLGGLQVPEKQGGAGLGMRGAVVALEALAQGDAAASLVLDGGQTAIAALVELGDEGQRNRWLPMLVAGTPATLAYAERWKVVDKGFSTIAQRAGGQRYLLTGVKSYVLGAADAALTIVFACTPGPSAWESACAFVVEGRPAGLRTGEAHAFGGLQGLPIAELVLEECAVPAAGRLEAAGDFAGGVRRLFARLALLGAARQVGLARAAHTYALAYTQDRTAFGRPVAHFQAIAFDLADRQMEIDAAQVQVRRAAFAVDVGAADAAVQSWQAAALASQVAWSAADSAVQLLGGAGYLRDHPVEKWLRDTQALALVGPSRAHCLECLGATSLGLEAPAFPPPASQAMVL